MLPPDPRHDVLLNRGAHIASEAPTTTKRCASNRYVTTHCTQSTMHKRARNIADEPLNNKGQECARCTQVVYARMRSQAPVPEQRRLACSSGDRGGYHTCVREHNRLTDRVICFVHTKGSNLLRDADCSCPLLQANGSNLLFEKHVCMYVCTTCRECTHIASHKDALIKNVSAKGDGTLLTVVCDCLSVWLPACTHRCMYAHVYLPPCLYVCTCTCARMCAHENLRAPAHA